MIQIHLGINQIDTDLNFAAKKRGAFSIMLYHSSGANVPFGIIRQHNTVAFKYKSSDFVKPKLLSAYFKAFL